MLLVLEMLFFKLRLFYLVGEERVFSMAGILQMR